MAAKKTATKILNPFDAGVSYEDFLKASKGKTVSAYLKGTCTDEQIQWIETEIENYKNNK